MGQRGPGAQTPKGEIKEICFTMYLHKQLVSIQPDIGVQPHELTLEIGRSNIRAANGWYIVGLDRGELQPTVLPRIKGMASLYGFDPACFALGAMIAIFKEGIDPYEVRGWSKLAYSNQLQRAWDSFGQWRVLYGE